MRRMHSGPRGGPEAGLILQFTDSRSHSCQLQRWGVKLQRCFLGKREADSERISRIRDISRDWKSLSLTRQFQLGLL
jgi:hypothetical protein